MGGCAVGPPWVGGWVKAHALELDRKSGSRIPNLLDTLAAAQAATGDFDSAAANARKALALPQTPQNKQLEAGLKARLHLYLEGKPYLETATGE